MACVHPIRRVKSALNCFGFDILLFKEWKLDNFLTRRAIKTYYTSYCITKISPHATRTAGTQTQNLKALFALRGTPQARYQFISRKHSILDCRGEHQIINRCTDRCHGRDPKQAYTMRPLRVQATTQLAVTQTLYCLDDEVQFTLANAASQGRPFSLIF